MKFQKISQRENVVTYQLSGAGMLVADKTFNLFLDQEPIAEGADPFANAVYADQYLVYLQNNGNTAVRDLKRDTITQAKISPLVPTISNGTIVAYTNWRRTPEKTRIADYGLYTIPALTLVQKLPSEAMGLCYRAGNDFLYVQRGVLHYLNLESQELVWSIEVGGIKKMLGIVDDVFWLEGALTATYSVVRGFDLATGKSVSLSEQIDLPAQPIVGLTPDGRSVFIVGQGASFDHAAYIEIDLVNRSIKRRGGLTSATLPDVKLALYEYTLAGDFIYGTAGLNGSSWPKAICVLNYHSLKTEWWQPLDSTPNAFLGGGHAPQVRGNEFFILDTEGFLHQYQRV